MGHAQFEDLLAREDYRTIIASGGHVTFEFPPSSALPAYVGLRFLSLANQLVESHHGRVRLVFQDREGLFGYLDRNGFLDLLDSRIETVPKRPAVSTASTLRGRTVGLVEIRELRLGAGVEEQQETVKELSDALLQFYATSPRTIRLGKNVYSVLGELIGNVYNHSQTGVPGFAILQAYLRGQRPRVQIAVSDSGLGIPQTIRRAVGQGLAGKPDDELILRAFSDGLSRHGMQSGRGCGLPLCARLAAEYGSDLYVRTPTVDVTLRPARPGQPSHLAEIRRGLGQLYGTHLCFEFRLDPSVLTT